MMKSNIVLVAVAGYVLGNLTACSHVANFFPDKEKDYQHTNEIPMLNWPAELRANPAPTPSATPPTALSPPSDNTTPAPEAELAPEDTAPAPLSDISSEIPEQAKPPSAADPVPDETGDTSKPVVIEQVKIDGSSRLRLNVTMIRAWRAVDKALSRNSIEVTERNPEERRYTIQYDPNEKKVQDGSLWDEAIFIFKGFEIDEKEYRLKLVESADTIEVQLVDGQQKTVADTVESLKLLDVLEKTIKAEFTGDKK
jgi:outer membrane protein assembly factor BamC